MSNQTKILLLIGAVVLLIFLFYNGNQQGTIMPGNPSTEGFSGSDNCSYVSESTDRGSLEAVPGTSSQVDSNSDNGGIPDEDMIKYFPQKDYAQPSWVGNKFNNRDKAIPGEYKRSSYNEGRRGNQGGSEWGAYFDGTNNVIGNAETGDNDKFLPVDETNSKFAVFKENRQKRASCGSNQNCSPEELFDVDKYLPQEVNDDWFEVTPEPISVKNRHLINITKPIGINTIGSSLKNSSWDLRGEPANPKFVVAPWNQSSIEPSANLKVLF